MNHSEQAAAAAALVNFAGDLLTWATQPAEALPEGWRAAYQERLNEVAGLVRRAFSEDREALAKLREVETEARDFIGILAANPAIAAKPVSEWPVADFRETFERLAAGRRWFGDRVRSLDSEDATQRSRKPSRGAAAGIDPSSNPFEKARQVLEEFAFIEDREPPFDLQQIELDPAAVQAWGLCVDAVAALPECGGGMMGISRRLQLRLDGTHCSPAGGGSAGVIWRWLNAPSGPWVNRHELQALRAAAAEFERQRSRTASAEAATQPAGPAIVEGPAASPERAAAVNPGSAPSGPTGSPAALQGDSGAAGASSDQTEVDAEALAVHCGCSSKRIRDILGTCEPSRKDDRGGRLWWRYGSILATLRQWCAETRTRQLRLVQWPANAAELRQRKKPQPESSKK